MTYVQTLIVGDRPIMAMFRDHTADAPGNMLQGHGIVIHCSFEAYEANQSGRLLTYEETQEITAFLLKNVDGKILAAQTDPNLDDLTYLAGMGLADVIVLPECTLAALAEYVHIEIEHWLFDKEFKGRVRIGTVRLVDLAENSASFKAGA